MLGMFICMGALLIGNLLRSMFVNPFTALAETNILGVLTAALLLGLAAALGVVWSYGVG